MFNKDKCRGFWEFAFLLIKLIIFWIYAQILFCIGTWILFFPKLWHTCIFFGCAILCLRWFSLILISYFIDNFLSIYKVSKVILFIILNKLIFLITHAVSLRFQFDLKIFVYSAFIRYRVAFFIYMKTWVTHLHFIIISIHAEVNKLKNRLH